MEEAPELISPRISFSHDLAPVATTACAVTQPAVSGRSDMSLMSLRRRRQLPEQDFDFANAAAADVAPADRLFADGKLLPVPPLPPAPHARARPSSCRHQQANGCVKPPHQAAWPQKRPARSWTSRFSRSSSVNSAETAAPSSGKFTCPFMRSRSAGSARDGFGSGGVTAGHPRPHCKKVSGGTAAASNGGGGGGRSVYYYGYGGGRNGSSSQGHGVRAVSPVLNVTSIGTSVVNLLSYLLCDCGEKTTKNRGFGVIS